MSIIFFCRLPFTTGNLVCVGDMNFPIRALYNSGIVTSHFTAGIFVLAGSPSRA